eukprot:TRINITY_DN12956_c0_g1_i1.p1 TRINITY_DN12956_c0_g1~~TRINITY_DN12956_c0_g1_i1.p1  ORF type:complete len:528 (+),score=77.29 TRINITY_DN12956_c0_g1_i1:72-1655(+)
MSLEARSFYLAPLMPQAEKKKLSTMLKEEGASIAKSPDGKDTVCILDTFESRTFQSLLSGGARIISSQHLCEVIEQGKPFPDLTHPLWAPYLEDYSLCIDESCVDGKNLLSLMYYMGAQHIPEPVKDEEDAAESPSSTKFLIAEKVGSMLYQLATQAHIQIVKPSWLLECWKQEAMLPYEAHLLPPFAGLVISVTGLTPSTREEINRLARAYGAEYTPNLTKRCTHLLSNSPQGIKYRYALEWGIHCVTPQWFFDSINANVALDETLYFVPMSEQRRRALFHPLSASSRDLSRLSPALREKHMMQISRRAKHPYFPTAARANYLARRNRLKIRRPPPTHKTTQLPPPTPKSAALATEPTKKSAAPSSDTPAKGLPPLFSLQNGPTLSSALMLASSGAMPPPSSQSSYSQSVPTTPPSLGPISPSSRLLSAFMRNSSGARRAPLLQLSDEDIKSLRTNPALVTALRTLLDRCSECIDIFERQGQAVPGSLLEEFLSLSSAQYAQSASAPATTSSSPRTEGDDGMDVDR